METSSMGSEYAWPLKIATYDTGPDQCLRPASILKLQQEVGELHLGAGGLGYQVLLEAGMAFLLTRTNCVIHRMPRLNETVTLRTWHRGTRGAQFYRCYVFEDARGVPLVESVTAFALVDVQDHRLLRPEAFDRFALATQTDVYNGCPDTGKWRPSVELQPVDRHVVRWSETDWNGHLNNTVYADYLCDYVPGGMAGKQMTGFSIAFLKEAREGEVLQMAAGADGTEAFVVGTHERGICFEAKMTFVPV